MKSILLYLTLFTFQSGTLNTLQDRPVVRLPLRQGSIPADYGGDEVDFKDGPPTLRLPDVPPKLDSHGLPWVVVLKNLGPSTVMIVGRAQFSVQLRTGQSVGIKSTDRGYVRLR
jgi:hypothetical protein